MKHLPEKIRVAGTDYDVEVVFEGEATAVTGVMGACSNIKAIICAGETGNKMTDLDTLIHEIHHAIWFMYGIHDEDDEERVVSILGTAWAQVYRDNPQLLKFINYCVK